MTETKPKREDIAKTPAAKSRSKAAGLKSTFAVNGSVLLTSFGRGNDAVPEKLITEKAVSEINTVKPRFSVEKPATSYSSSFGIKSHISATADNPLAGRAPVGEDAIHAKEVLEQRVFGKTFSDDNIHIQLIYNILDIRKILSTYANNVVFTINSMRRLDEYDREQDYLGSLYTGNSYERLLDIADKYAVDGEDWRNTAAGISNDFEKKQFQTINGFWDLLDMIEPYMCYFSEAFFCETTVKDPDSGRIVPCLEQRSDGDIYNILRILSIVRQTCMHDNASMRTVMFTLGQNSVRDRKNGFDELAELLDYLYDEKIDIVNRDFLRNQKNNIELLSRIYGSSADSPERDRLVQNFYDFRVLSQDKNLGFSIKKLREKLLDSPALSVVRSKKYDTMRSKIYSLIDFMIYRKFSENHVAVDDFVEELRSLLTEDEKESAYSRWAETLINDGFAQEILVKLLPQTDPAVIGKIKGKKLLNDSIAGIKLKKDASFFTKIINVLCMFQDGKEINELVSSLVNKFANIQSFVDVMRSQGIDSGFTADYAMFAESGRISRELHILKGIARMQHSIAGLGDVKIYGSDDKFHGVSRRVYTDAAYILGFGERSEDNDGYVDDYVSSKLLGGADKNLRNFITNNVIKNRRFLYTVRYMNPKRAKKLVQNDALVVLALSGIPETQIDRYYKSCIEKRSFNPDLNEKIAALSEMITTLKIDDFEDVKQNPEKNANYEAKKNQRISKERYKACIGLYLTVLYLICKNLVKINARYSIAIGCLERDTQLHGVDFKGAAYMTRDVFIAKGWINPKKPTVKSIKEQYAFLTPYIFTTYRNMIAHLAAVTNAYKYIPQMDRFKSWFHLYHTVIQHSLIQQYEYDRDYGRKGAPVVSERVLQLLEQCREHSNYSRDLLHILNLPFGYNLPRYLNLSSEKYFDANAI